MLDGPEGDSTSIYLARADEVELYRPLLTGDIVADVEIPGVELGTGHAIVVEHPCAMRRGSELREYLIVARIVSRPDLPSPDTWPTTGHWDLFPLPALDGSDTRYAASLDLVGRVPSETLVAATRIACLSDSGIALLLQRQIHRLCRFRAPLGDLYEVCAPVLTEAELLAEWNEGLVPLRGPTADAEIVNALREESREFDSFLGKGDGSLRYQLGTDRLRSSVRQAVRQEIRDRQSIPPEPTSR